MGAGDGAGPGDALAAADDAGNRCRMVWVAVGRSGDEFVGQVEPSERVHRRHFEGVVQGQIREQARDTLGEHGLADTWRAVEEHVMPAGSGYLAGPLGLDLTDHVCQVETTLGVLAGRVAHHLDRVDQRHRLAPQEGDQLGDRGNTEDLDAFDEFRLSGLAQRHDHPREARLLGRQEWRAKRRGPAGADHPTQARPTGLFRVVLRLGKTPCAASTAATIAKS